MSKQNDTNENYILTFGYGNRKNYDDLLKYIEEFNISCVIDLRLKPRAWTRKWYGSEIEKFCNSQNVKYISKTALGNTSGNKNWIPPNESEAQQALSEVSKLAQSQTTLLLCAELKSSQCHRVAVAQELHQLTNIVIKHLE